MKEHKAHTIHDRVDLSVMAEHPVMSRPVHMMLEIFSFNALSISLKIALSCSFQCPNDEKMLRNAFNTSFFNGVFWFFHRGVMVSFKQELPFRKTGTM